MSREINEVLDELAEAADRRERVAVGTLVEAFGRRGYGALLLIPALLEISPLGAVPGVPSVLALAVALFAVQMLFGREHMWLPGILREREVPSDKLDGAVERLRPLAERLDRWFHGRLGALTGSIAVRLVAALCVLLAATVPPLEIVPFASTAPMATIAVLGTALLVHDGVLVLVGLVLSAASLGVVGAVLA